MNVEMNELIAELERQFPKELTICIQAVQIRKLQEQLATDDSDTDEPDLAENEL